jgi:Adenosine specific kinase
MATFHYDVCNGTENANILVGQSHFIKTVEDIYEAIVNTVPNMKFGIAFNEVSGACLTRVDGNDAALMENATGNAQLIGAGHVFVVSMREGYPINVLNRSRGSTRSPDRTRPRHSRSNRRQQPQGHRIHYRRRMAPRPVKKNRL